MKTDSVTFGQTYITPSIRYLSAQNRKKLPSLYPLGQIYPVDIFLGANRKGDLTVAITQSSPYDYLLVNDKIKLTPQNMTLLKIIKSLQNSYRQVHGLNQPVKKVTVPYLDYIPEETLPFYIADEIEEYGRRFFNKFYN